MTLMTCPISALDSPSLLTVALAACAVSRQGGNGRGLVALDAIDWMVASSLRRQLKRSAGSG